MVVGILSDSHGRTEPVQQALAVFDRIGVDHVIHCGDVGDIAVFELFADRDFTFVWGNCDYPAGGLLAFLHSLSIPVPDEVPTTLVLDSRTLAVFHGHEPGFDDACLTGGFDYILHGHTHEQRDERIGATRIINPGALHRARVKTVATLNLVTDDLAFHKI